MRGRYDQLVVHNAKLTKGVPPSLLLPLFCGAGRGRFAKPAELTILLVHNHAERTLMEQSLEYLGVVDATVLRVSPNLPWRHTARITRTLEYLKSGACRTEYILATDCDDALLRDDPAKAIALLNEADCDMLISSTAYARYRNMPEVKERMVALAPAEMRRARKPRIHLNAGVFVARTKFLTEYMSEAAQYVTANDLPSDALADMSDAQVLSRMPDFPRGIGSDQTIMRYLFPRFYPRMKIDYRSRLAFR